MVDYFVALAWFSACLSMLKRVPLAVPNHLSLASCINVRITDNWLLQSFMYSQTMFSTRFFEHVPHKELSTVNTALCM